MDGWQVLHKACINKGSTSVIKKILAYSGVDINDQNDEGNSPLHVAAAFGQAEMARFLIESGAEINITSRKGETPLDFARYGNSLAVIPILELCRARSYSEEKLRFQQDFTPTLSQAYHESFLSDAEINSLTNGQIDLLLHQSIDEQDLEKATFFIKKGGGVNTQGGNGETALHLAAKAGRWEACYSLINEGADVFIKDMMGFQALHRACNSLGAVDFIEFLILTKAADVNARNYQRDTAVHLATKANNLDALKRLIELGGALDLVNIDGDTQLHIAAKLGLEEAMSLFVQSGGYLYSANRRELTPMHILAKKRAAIC